MKSIVVRLAVLVAALAAIVAPGAAPASAAPATPAAITCWTEFDTYKTGQTIYVSAIKDCTNLDVPQNLTLTLQVYLCDDFGVSCSWLTWKSGTGVVSYTCPGTFWAPFRNSRLPSKVVYCD